MNRRRLGWIAGFLALSVLMVFLGGTMKGKPKIAEQEKNTTLLWNKVEQAEKDGLPQTAIDLLKQIVIASRAEKRDSEFLRALTRQIILEALVKGNKPEHRVNRLMEELDQAPVNLKPMMKLILAQWYRSYYSRNRWRFMSRAATQGLEEKDFTTWDLPKLFKEIDGLYRDGFKEEAFLKKTPLSDYKDILIEGNLPPSIRPTLFDFLVFEALDFYTSAEQAAARPEDAFEIPADSAALGPLMEFLSYAPETSDKESPKLQALKLYQIILTFHLNDKDPDALLDADLQRLSYVKNVAVGEGVSDRYLERLKAIVVQTPSSSLQSLAYYQWAQELYNREDFAQAYRTAGFGEEAHPSSLGAENCKVLRGRITAKDYELLVESVLQPGLPAQLAVSYRNITALHFRVVKEDFSALLKNQNAESFFGISHETVRRLVASRPEAEWSIVLKPTADYKEHTALANVPPLKPGFYRILASFNKDFALDHNKVQTSSFWVTSLGLITNGMDAAVNGYIVRNGSGEPVASTEVSLFEWSHNLRSFTKSQARKTDELGSFSFPADPSSSQYMILVRDGGEELAEFDVPRNFPYREKTSTRTLFFTDRSLYRPGQTIFFKGICLSVNRDQDDYKLLPQQKVKVFFRDTNGQEVSGLDLVTNDFGSFSGAFTAPTDRLTGEMTIVTENPEGSCTVRIEEYKRPKFQVKLDVPDKEFRLNDRVALSGEAMAYTGAPVDGALVRFRVVRRVEYPRWWLYLYVEALKNSQEIEHGTLRTDESGKFKIEFQAKPEPSVSASASPIFTYSITADVTDSAGETRSAGTSVRLGYASLKAGMSCADWLEKDRPTLIEVTTTTLNDKKVAAKGEVEIYSLKGPDKPVPSELIGEAAVQEHEAFQDQEVWGSPNKIPDWWKWPEGPLAGKKAFETSAKEDVRCRLSFDLAQGVYKAKLKTKDKFGTAVESVLLFMVMDPAAKKFEVKIPFFCTTRNDRVEVGQTCEILWGTGYDQGPVLIEILQNNQWLQRYWTPGSQTQGLLRIPVEEKLSGGFTVILTLVKENRFYRNTMPIRVPWSNKELDLKWRTFRSKLQPGQPETWSLSIKTRDAMLRAAEIVATLYDASLDQFYEHRFPSFLDIFRRDWTYIESNFSTRRLYLQTFLDSLNTYQSFTSRVYTHFADDIIEDAYGYGYPAKMKAPAAARRERAAEPPPPTGPIQEEIVVVDMAGGTGVAGGVPGGVPGGSRAEPDLSKVQARKNLNETAFFFPRLLTDKDGVVTLEFKMPEALTEWRFIGFAHTKNLESGSIEDRAVTQKELMVQPNPPRFLREGDRLEFTVKVTNMTDKEASGSVQLTFFDPRTEKTLDKTLSNAEPKLSFTVPAKQSRSFAWPLSVSDGLEVVGYKAVAATQEFSDGEEGLLPVMNRRLFIRESIPLWISGQGEKTFVFEKLLKSGTSETLRNQGLIVQMASNPAWYAVQALPFLMEFPYECSEQVFNRLYANGLAQKIANSNPKIRRIFDLWKGAGAFQSNLEKNEDLKSALLQESPWVLEAKNESQAKRNVGLLFDENRISQELKSALFKLQNMQLSDGSWPWFPGGRGNEYITLYIVTGFGRLKQIGVKSVPQDMALKALGALDRWISEVYQEILKDKTQKQNHLSSTLALYLYGRSFFLRENPIPETSRKAVDYFLKQAVEFWLSLDCRQSQAHLALALNRFADKTTAQKIVRSMKERSQTDGEMGRFWNELEMSWWWHRAPIETQAVMIEAFDEVMNDTQAVEECKIWLLKQKQTQNWKTTKATADAVYGLILRGTDLLASESVVKVKLAGTTIEPESVEAGTGFYEKHFEPSAIIPAMGNIVVTKTDKGVAWGGVHWQYLEDISKITPHAQNPLKLNKSVFVQRLTKKGPVIEPVKEPLAVGDTLIIRIELRTDRDMEYLHMKDYRGSGLEPMNVLSQYKFQGGLVYYESTKDTAAHFFIDYLPKGTYVFEYPLRIQHRGVYQNGMAHIECMYAPEFNSHSDSVKLEVK